MNFNDYLAGRAKLYKLLLDKIGNEDTNQKHQYLGMLQGINYLCGYVEEDPATIKRIILERSHAIESDWDKAMTKAEKSGGLLTGFAAANKAEKLWGEMMLLGRAKRWLRTAAITSAED